MKRNLDLTDILASRPPADSTFPNKIYPFIRCQLKISGQTSMIQIVRSDGGSEEEGQMERSWAFLSTHGLVLLAIASDPHATQRQIANVVGVTEKTVQKAIGDLVADGYVQRFREGRRNSYEIDSTSPLRHSLMSREAQIGTLVELVGRPGTGADATAAS